MLFLLFALGLVFVLGDILLPLIPADSAILTIKVRNNFLFAETTSPLIALGATLLSMFLAAKFLDKRRFRDFGFHREKGWWNDFIFGLGLGAVLMMFIFLVELNLGWIRITGFFTPREGNPFWFGILLDLITFVCVGIYEEMLLRGYVLRNLAEGLNYKRIKPGTALLLATVFSSGIFSVLHLTNPGASAMSFINLLIGGIFLSLGFIFTGELAIPIGLHIAWNFFQGAVFGFPVSGLPAVNPVISIEQILNGPMTGSIFGPEAGFIGLFATLLGSIFILIWVRKRKSGILLHSGLAVYQNPTQSVADLTPMDSNSESA